MPEISPQTQKLIQRYQTWQKSLQPKEEGMLHVDEVVAKVAVFYEKIRGVIDWREEHLIRKTAIERIVKRRLFLMETGKEMARPFILELIRGGHFPNDSIPESKIETIQKAIDKYVFILKNGAQKEEERIEIYDWLLSIAASEVEETLSPPIREKALIDYMTEIMQERIEVKEGALIFGGMKEEEKNTQIYINVQKSLFKFDIPLISYHLLERKFPQWSNLPPEKLEEVAKNINLIRGEIEKELSHPLAEKFYKIAENYDTAYLIMGDIISQDPVNAPQIISQPEVFENLVRKEYQKRFQRAKEKVKRAAIYSTLSIFITKILLALTAEAWFDKLTIGKVNYFSLGLNITMPPLLMGLLILSIRPPSKENLPKVIMEIMKVAYKTQRKDIYQIKPPLKRGFFMNLFLLIFYFLSFFVSFGFIIWALLKLEFGILSVIIFLIFLSLILFAATRIRQRAKELEIGEEKESTLTFIFDFLTLPIIRVGKWLSHQWERYNILVVIFNLLIELPFQFFTEFLEQLRYFWKEKKEEIH